MTLKRYAVVDRQSAVEIYHVSHSNDLCGRSLELAIHKSNYKAFCRKYGAIIFKDKEDAEYKSWLITGCFVICITITTLSKGGD